MCAILARYWQLQGGGSVPGDLRVRKGSCWLQSPNFDYGSSAQGNTSLYPMCPVGNLEQPGLYLALGFPCAFCLSQPKNCRKISHYQYMSWPDHGVPQQPGGVLSFLTQVNAIQAENGKAGPMIIHCRYDIVNLDQPADDSWCDEQKAAANGQIHCLVHRLLLKVGLSASFSNSSLRSPLRQKISSLSAAKMI